MLVIPDKTRFFFFDGQQMHGVTLRRRCGSSRPSSIKKMKTVEDPGQRRLRPGEPRGDPEGPRRRARRPRRRRASASRRSDWRSVDFADPDARRRLGRPRHRAGHAAARGASTNWPASMVHVPLSSASPAHQRPAQRAVPPRRQGRPSSSSRPTRIVEPTDILEMVNAGLVGHDARRRPGGGVLGERPTTGSNASTPPAAVVEGRRHRLGAPQELPAPSRRWPTNSSKATAPERSTATRFLQQLPQEHEVGARRDFRVGDEEVRGDGHQLLAG
ncbi:MAG: hypothetical protein MZU95_01140 [Desulfomicrobium escambiense]|nr:hypothetical protein [Desulfomicrobium escambiense]